MDKSKLFKQAHKLKKEHSLNMSEALKMAYKRVKFNSLVSKIVEAKDVKYNEAYRLVYAEFPYLEVSAKALKVRMLDILFTTGKIIDAIEVAKRIVKEAA